MSDCPRCGAHLPPDAFDATLGLAQCPACGEISEGQPPPPAPQTADEPDVSAWFEEAPGPGVDDEPPPAPVRRLDRDSHHGWADRSDTALVLVKPWLNGSVGGVVLFAVVWNVILFGGFLGNGLGILCLPHAWIGIAFGYYAVASLVNQTTITLDHRGLWIAHGPLPWWGQRQIARSDIDQIYAKMSAVQVNKRPRWNLVAVAPDGGEQALVRLLASPDEARWLERRLEDAMGIVDRRVEGEY